VQEVVSTPLACQSLSTARNLGCDSRHRFHSVYMHAHQSLVEVLYPKFLFTPYLHKFEYVLRLHGRIPSSHSLSILSLWPNSSGARILCFHSLYTSKVSFRVDWTLSSTPAGVTI